MLFQFKTFLEQEIWKYEDSVEDSAENVKNTREFNEPTVVQYEKTYYLVSGNQCIFKLGDDGIEKFATLLSREEIEQLPETIMYTGEEESFKE